MRKFSTNRVFSIAKKLIKRLSYVDNRHIDLSTNAKNSFTGFVKKDQKQLTLDEKIILVQRSTKTLVPKAAPLHEYLRQKYRWYYNWHLNNHAPKVHYSVLTVSVMLIASILFSTVFPTGRAEAATSTKVWDTKADFQGGTVDNSIDLDSESGKAKLKTVTQAVDGDFTTDSQYDSGLSSSVGWDTAEQKLALSGSDVGIYSDLKNKLISAWGSSETITAFTYDFGNARLYYATDKTSIGYYNLGGSVDLTSQLSPVWSSESVNISSLAYDSANDRLYLGGLGGKFAQISGGVATNLVAKISSFWSTNGVNAMAYSSSQNLLYIGGDNAKVATYDGTTATSVSLGSDTQVVVKFLPIAGSVWLLHTTKLYQCTGTSCVFKTSSTYNDMSYVSSQNKIYVARNSGYYDIWNITAGTKSSVQVTEIGANHIYNIACTASNYCYMSTSNNKLWKIYYAAPNTKTDITAGLVTATGNSTFGKLELVGTDVYIGLSLGKLAKHDGSNFTNLSTEISSNFHYLDAKITSTAYGDGYLYVGSHNGKFAKYDTGTEAISDLTSGYSAVCSTTSAYKMVYDTAGHTLYFACDSFGLSKYQSGAFSAVDAALSYVSTTTITSNNVVYYGTFGGKIGKIENGIKTDLTTTTNFAALWSTTLVRAVGFNESTNTLFVGADNKIVSITGGVATDQTAALTSTWTSFTGIRNMAYKPDGGVLYISGFSGTTPKFASHNGSNFTDLTAAFSTVWPSGIYTDAMTVYNSKLYLAGGACIYQGLGYTCEGSSPPRLASYDGITVKDLSEPIAAAVGNNHSLVTLTFVGSTMFIGGNDNKLLFGKIVNGFSTEGYGVTTALDSTTAQILSGTLTATENIVAGTSVNYYLSANGSTWEQVTLGQAHDFSTSGSELRVKFELNSNSSDISPEITAFNVSFTSLTSTSGTITLTLDATKEVGFYNLSQQATIPTGSALSYKVKSATTTNGLDAAVYSNAITSLPHVFTSEDITDNQFIRIEVTLTSTNGVNSPTLDAVSLDYVDNARPEAEINSATYQTDGSKTISIAYSLKDANTADNPNDLMKNKATVGFQYSVDDGINWTSISDDLVSGDKGVVAVGASSFQSHSSVINLTTLGDIFSDQFKIKISANDGELARNIGSADSAAITVDTKIPTVGATPISINAAAAKTNNRAVTLTLDATDDSAKKVCLSEDQSCPDDSAYQAFSASMSFTLSSGDGTKTVYAKFKDVLDNVLDTFYSDTIELDTFAPTPNAFRAFDASDSASSTYKTILSWAKLDNADFAKYYIERSETSQSSGFAALTNTATIATDMYSDTNLDSEKTYYYRIYSTDALGNQSAYSAAARVLPNGAIIDIDAPIVVGAPASEPSDKTATITWVTDDFSDSFVEFGLTSGYGTSQGKVESVKNHSVTISGLLASTEYYFKVTSRDASNNLGVGPDQTLTTLADQDDHSAPTLADPEPEATPDITSATIAWHTNEASDSFVEFGTTTDYGKTQGSFDATSVDHSVILSGLGANTTYNYRLKSKDVSGNILTSGNYTFQTLADPTDRTAPVLVTPTQAATPDVNSATIVWHTDETSDSFVEYGLTTDYGKVFGNSLPSADHTVIVSGLESNTTYNYRLKSRDGSGNLFTSGDYTFKTLVDPTDRTAPVISNIQTGSLTYNSAIVTWDTTDENSNSYVEYGPTNSYGLIIGNEISTKTHSVSLAALTASTTYHFRLRSTDSSGNLRIGADQTFATLADAVDHTVPTISNVEIAPDLTTAVVTWHTTEDSNSFVDIGTTASYGTAQGINNAVSDHSVTLVGLTANTAYHLRVRSADSSKNEAIGDDQTFSTIVDPADKTAPTISNVQTNSLTFNSINITWDTTESATSNIEYGPTVSYGNIAGTSGSGANHAVSISNLSPSTTYHFRPLSRDLSSNLTTGNDQTFTTLANPADVAAPVISGIGAVSDVDSAVISWDTNELANSFVEFGPTTSYGNTQGINNSVTVHSVTLVNLNQDTNYHFRIRSTDISKNEAVGDDQLFTTLISSADVTAPTISGKTATPAITTATIAWTTNEFSDSFVEYSTGEEVSTLFGSLTETKNHSVTISALSPSTRYDYKVRSKDSTGNEAVSVSGNFTTLADPTDVVAPIVSNLQTTPDILAATISWNTNENSNSFVEFGTNTDYGSTQGINNNLSNHSVVIIGLTANTAYHFRIRSTDASKNECIGDDQLFTTLADAGDQTAPTLESEPIVNNITTSSAIIEWTTNESADSFVEYGMTNSYTDKKGKIEKIAEHTVQLTGLAPNTTYHFRIKSADLNNNILAGNDLTFKTIDGSVEDLTPPSISGTNPTVDVNGSEVTVSWNTDEDSTSFIQLGKVADTLDSMQGSDLLTKNHSVKLIGLDYKTTYYYSVKSSDSSGNAATKENLSFKTDTSEQDKIAPTISGATVQKPGTNPEEVTIIWTTDKPSTSKVLYGKSELMGEESAEEINLNTTHFIHLTGLEPNTRYFYQPSSKDGAGNIVLGEKKYFVTSQSILTIPSISAAEVSEITLDSAIITWETTTVTTSIIAYGEDTNYGKEIRDDSLSSTTKHTVKIRDLNQGARSHFRIMGTDQSNNLIASDDYVFSTQTLPSISEIEVKEISSNKATVAWSTNIDTDSFIDYEAEGTESLSQGRSEQVKDHAITLTGLNPATTYRITIKSRDKYGNLVESKGQLIKTIIDTLAPDIKDLKSETSIITDSNGDSKAQAIISWSTDEPSTSQAKYSMGVALADSYAFSTEEETGLTTSHIIIISNLQLSATYHMRIISKDSSNNIGTSDDYTVLTLNQDKSLLQYIVQILEQRFSWVKGFEIFK